MSDPREPIEHLREALGEGAPDVRRAGLGALAVGSAGGRLLRFPRMLGRRLRVLLFGLLIVGLSVTTCSVGVDPASLTDSYGPPVQASTADALSFFEKGAEAVERFSGGSALRLSVTEAEATAALSLGMMLPDLMQALGRVPPEEIRSATDLEVLRDRVWLEQEAVRDSLLAGAAAPLRFLSILDPRIRTGDVQIRFRESGQVVVGGFVQAWSFKLPAMFVVAPSAGVGALELDFVEGRLGRMPAPTFVFDWLGGMIARGVLLGRDYAEVTELTVTEGRLVFEGIVRADR